MVDQREACKLNQEFQKSILDRCPLLYAGRHSSIRESLIPFGFDVGDGWYDLLYNVSVELESEIEDLSKEHSFGCICSCKKEDHFCNTGACQTTYKVPLWKPKLTFAYYALNDVRLSTRVRVKIQKFKRKINRFVWWLAGKGLLYKTSNCECPTYTPNLPKATQVKEKFGELRLYMCFATDKMYNIIDNATRKSCTICEVCGESGETRFDIGWDTTLCNEHHRKK